MGILTSKDVNGDTSVYAGAHLLAIITKETEPDKIATFVKLCEARAEELRNIGIEYEDKRCWNFAHPGQGKNWPVFNRRDKIVRELCKQAQIVDS